MEPAGILYRRLPAGSEKRLLGSPKTDFCMSDVPCSHILTHKIKKPSYFNKTETILCYDTFGKAAGG